jgi:ARG/rhodanese/phosphatase superfamily protein
MIMKNLPFLLLLLLFACNNDSANTNNASSNKPSTALKSNNINVETTLNTELDYEKLRIYPIVADEDFIADYSIASNFKNLKEAIDTKGFRITEHKPFGRFEDNGAVNNLTVQNKSQNTIYLMAGDVVQGGKQDRVLAVDMVVPPRTITNIAVFCVEPNRWEYKVENQEMAIADDHLSEQNKKIFAFTGYYNVASNDLRKTMKQTNDQGAVWKKVGDLTALNNAESATGAYTNLENSKSFTAERNEYVHFFTNKFDQRDDVVGIVAVSGSKVLGVDIFTHPNLFKKQYEVLIHSYITEAISAGDKVIMTQESINRYAENLNQKFNSAIKTPKNDQSSYHYNGQLIHFSDL